MSSVRYFSFVCPFCNFKQQKRVNYEIHIQRLESNPNGLLTYSDLHTCDNGILNLVDLRVDADLNVRTVEKFKLMNERLTSSNLPIPIIQSNTSRSVDEFNFLSTNERFRIKSELFNFDIQFGKIPENTELHEISSTTEDITLQYTGHKNTELEAWLLELVNIVEMSPPKELGILLEAFQYIFEVQPNQPTAFDIEILKTMFVSHEVYVTPIIRIEEEFLQLLEHHNINEAIAAQIHATASEEEKMSLLELTSITKSLTTTIYYSMLLEKHKLLEMERPGILERPFYLRATDGNVVSENSSITA